MDNICDVCGKMKSGMGYPEGQSHEDTCTPDAAYRTAEKYWREREGIGPDHGLSPYDEREIERAAQYVREHGRELRADHQKIFFGKAFGLITAAQKVVDDADYDGALSDLSSDDVIAVKAGVVHSLAAALRNADAVGTSEGGATRHP